MRPRLLLLSALSLVPACAAQAAEAAAPIDQRVRDLLARMTVEEKVGQLIQYSSRGEVTGPAVQTDLVPKLRSGRVGSLLNVHGAAKTREMQELAVKSSRLGIPLLFGFDVIHGYRTIFPIPLATAASWDMDAIERAERVAAIEAAAAGLHWTFAPMVDVARDARWGRIAEGAGEDPFLGSAIARARVRGFQTASLGGTDALLACAKHFAAYGAAQAGRDYFTTDITERVLRDVYLPPFQAAVQAGVATFMSGFNDLDGTPCTGNDLLLRRVLREEWGFRGFVVSDWASIAEMVKHGNVPDLRAAAALAMNAGLDMDMEGDAYENHLVALVQSGEVPMARLDAAAGAVLAAKFQLGLFEDPYRFSDPARETERLGAAAHRETARDLARRSAVLLKNTSGRLPLQLEGRTVALIGPLADHARDQLGCWAGAGRPEHTVTLRAAFAELLPPDRLRYAPGCATTGDDRSGFPAAIEAAVRSDVIVLALGESADQSGEARSRTSLDFSGPQLPLLRELHALGKPIVLVVMAGRPLVLGEALTLADAVLVGWHPGTMGGPGLADVLTGAWNPSGKLPLSWPRAVGQLPLFYAVKNSGRPEPLRDGDRYYSHYIDEARTPQFPFGFGLSYTTFELSAPVLSSTVMRPGGGPLHVATRLKNTGTVAGEEVVQLYVRDLVGSVTRPVRELKGFRKVALAPGEEREVVFELTEGDLAFWNARMEFAAEPGDFELYVGTDADAVLSARFRLER